VGQAKSPAGALAPRRNDLDADKQGDDDCNGSCSGCAAAVHSERASTITHCDTRSTAKQRLTT